MLPAEFRLKLGKSDLKALGGRKEIYTPLFKFVYSYEAVQDPPKIAFIVSGKIGKSAKRNKIRRLLVEAVRKRISDFKRGLKGIIIATNNDEKEYEKVSDWIDKILQKLN